MHAVVHAPEPTLVGVVGEFSSGKSTLINGLLARRLLKTSCLPSTARPTYIRAGEELAVAASVLGVRWRQATVANCFDLAFQVRWARPEVSLNSSLHDLIDLITSDPVVSASVGKIDIRTPGFPFGPHTILVDTPGIAAGSATARGHDLLTEGVIQKELDCAIVAIPAASPMTRTLIEFLTTTLRPLASRSVYVLTGVDRHDRETRADVLRYVRGMLTRDCGLERPTLFEAGLWNADGDGARTGSDEPAGYWQQRMDDLRAALSDWLQALDRAHTPARVE